jgi:cellulase/cellobiase CelA1
MKVKDVPYLGLGIGLPNWLGWIDSVIDSVSVSADAVSVSADADADMDSADADWLGYKERIDSVSWTKERLTLIGRFKAVL